jgi:tetratricopeptide (TPR) repeat protein
LDKAIELDPDYNEAYNSRGGMYKRLGKYEQAIADYNKAIELDPNYATAYNNRGSAYNHLGKYEQAITDLNRAIELNPNYVTAYNNRGFAYNSQGKYERAIADLNKAIELNPNYVTAYDNRGVAYYYLREYEQVIADYTKIIERDPDFARAYNNRGFAYSQVGKYEQAITDFNKAIKLDPDYTAAYTNRKATYRRLAQNMFCALTVDRTFAETYRKSRVKALLGCPIAEAITLNAAIQPFEAGLTIWNANERAIYVLSSDNTWARYNDTWDESQPDIDPSLTPPEGLQQPVRGFGKVWREQLGGAEASIGWAKGAEQGYTTMTQSFENGQMIVGNDGAILILYADGTWE